MENLSERDKAVLRSIFDPTVTIAANVVDDSDEFVDDAAQPTTDAEKEAVNLSAQAVRLAEAGKLEEALSLMNQAVGVAPERAEVYNDRAQLLRLLERDDEPTTDAEKEAVNLSAQAVRLAEAGKLEEALSLMNQAVGVAPERAEVYNDRAQLLRLLERDDEAMLDIERALQLTCGKQSRARALALCQRGLLMRKRGDDAAARAAFADAAQMGSGFAKKQVVELNPYAALCNQMLSQVLRGDKEIKL